MIEELVSHRPVGLGVSLREPIRIRLRRKKSFTEASLEVFKMVAADLRAATERCNRSGIGPDLSVATSTIMAARRSAATFKVSRECLFPLGLIPRSLLRLW